MFSFSLSGLVWWKAFVLLFGELCDQSKQAKLLFKKIQWVVDLVEEDVCFFGILFLFSFDTKGLGSGISIPTKSMLHLAFGVLSLQILSRKSQNMKLTIISACGKNLLNFHANGISLFLSRSMNTQNNFFICHCIIG